jgi:hypothetical protein
MVCFYDRAAHGSFSFHRVKSCFLLIKVLETLVVSLLKFHVRTTLKDSLRTFKF